MNTKNIFLIAATILLNACFSARFPVTDDTPRLSENDFDISIYQPFNNNGKVATLDTVSSLELENNLPVLDGATALYPLYSAFAQAVYPKKNYKIRRGKVMCNNTMTAYQSLLKKKVDIIFVARPSKQQIELAEKQGIIMKFTPIAKEAFVFFVNKNNPVNSLTINELQDIYSGKIKGWNEIGGNNDSIIAFQRNEGSGSQTEFINFMNGKEIMKPKTDEKIYGMGMIISRVADYANYGNSIGFSFRFFTNEMVNNHQVKLLSIDEICPDVESIRNQTYPLASDLYAVTLSDNTNPNVAKFLKWILSPQGQVLVEKTGYCSIYRDF